MRYQAALRPERPEYTRPGPAAATALGAGAPNGRRAAGIIPPVRPLVLVNGLLLLATAGAIGAVQLLDRTPLAIESAVLRYATAVTYADREAALAELAPDVRDTWAPWVELRLGDRYDVRAVSVRAPSMLDRLLRGVPGTPSEATVVLDVNREVPGAFYQPSTRVPVAQVAGRWYLVQPLLAPESG